MPLRPPPPGIPPEIWGRINPAAKKTMFSLGSTKSGIEATRAAIITLASELRVLGVPRHLALQAARALPFKARSKDRRTIERATHGWVQFAYDKPQALLSGCPSVSLADSPMRDSFSAYCDDACKATCLIRRAKLAPEMVLVGTDYYATALSSIWLSGRQGGLAPSKPLWTLMASMAVLESTPLIHYAMPYIVRRFHGSVSLPTLYRHSGALQRVGLITLTNRKKGIYLAPALSEAQLSDLEDRLNVKTSASHNVSVAEYASERRDERFEDAGILEREPVPDVEIAHLRDEDAEDNRCLLCKMLDDSPERAWKYRKTFASSGYVERKLKPWTVEDERLLLSTGVRAAMDVKELARLWDSGTLPEQPLPRVIHSPELDLRFSH